MEALLTSVISGLVVGVVVLIATYFMRKANKVDDFAEKYATKTEIEALRLKVDKSVQVESCRASRAECVGRNWMDVVARLEQNMYQRLDELYAMMLTLTKEMAELKGKKNE